MNTTLYEELKRYSKHIGGCFDVSCGVFDLDKGIIDYQGRPTFCEYCNSCVYSSTHLYGCYEAERWNGKYIYYCPMGMIFLAHVVSNSFKAEGGLVTGPILMGGQEDLDIVVPPDIRTDTVPFPNLSTKKVRDISELIQAVTTLLSSDKEEPSYMEKLELALNNSLYEIGEKLTEPARRGILSTKKKSCWQRFHRETRNKHRSF